VAGGATIRFDDNGSMNEDDARDVILVKAIEVADTAGQLLGESDRRHAARAAAELARWQAADDGKPASAEAYLAKRARLLLGKLQERSAAVGAVARGVTWRPWIGVVMPAAAFVGGVVLEHVSDRHEINILALPMIGIVAWNVAVYVVLAALALKKAFSGVAPTRRPRGHWLVEFGRRVPAALRGPIGSGRERALATALAAFVAEWTVFIAPLATQRAARVLHLAAALFALGAVLGLYVRGLVFEYRAGWESTFLDATQVHAIFAFFFGPAARLAGMPLPSVDDVAAIRLGSGGGGENAARWIHLVAITVGLVVILPRAALAAAAAATEWHRRGRLRLDLRLPYYRRLAGTFASGPARMRVAPYSFTVDEKAQAGLRDVARRLLGEDAELTLRPSVAFGAEEGAAEGLPGTDPQVALTVALFNLASTPETENHGVFLDRLREGVATAFAVLVDEGGYRTRLGAQGGASERLQERRRAWMSFCASRRVAAACVDLSAPALAQLEQELAPALQGAE